MCAEGHGNVTDVFGDAWVQGQWGTVVLKGLPEGPLGELRTPLWSPASSMGLCSLITHTYLLWPPVLRSKKQATITSWMVPGPSTSQGSKRAILASIPARLRIRPGEPRETSILPYSVSEGCVLNSQSCDSRDRGAYGGHHRSRPYPQEPTEQTTQRTVMWLTKQ